MFGSTSRKSGKTTDVGEESRPQVSVSDEGGVREVALSGVWTTRTVAELDAELRELETAEDGKKVRLDLSGVEKMDTAGAWIVERFLAACTGRGLEIEIAGPSEAVSTLLSAVHEAANENEPAQGSVGGPVTSYEYEPDELEILSALLPKNLGMQIFRALLENNASEQGARMTAMDSATRNAGEMINKLTITYNRSRQAAITKELIEIISGAEAV